VLASDFDGDGKVDIAITTFDSLFVLYNIGGYNGTTGVHSPHITEPSEGFVIAQNYPNPFNPSTTIGYTLSTVGHVTLKIYNILGQEVVTLVDEDQVPGTHSVVWNGKSTNGSQVCSGVYFYRVEARQYGGQFMFTNVNKMMLIK
jgi:hypothetical protein